MNTINEVYSLFLNDKIYINNEKITNDSQLSSDSATSCKKTLYIVEWSEKVEFDMKYKELITKMNAAIKYEVEEMEILCVEKGTLVNILQLKENYGCELIALFGNFINSSNSQMNFPLNKAMIINEVRVIQTNSIEEIYTDASLKSLFWNAIKTILV